MKAVSVGIGMKKVGISVIPDTIHSFAGPKVFGKLRGDLDRKFSDLLADPEDAITGYLYHCNAQNPS